MIKNKKIIGIIATILIALLLGAGVWYFFMQNNTTKEITQKVEQEVEEEEEVEGISIIGSTWKWNMFEDTAGKNNIKVDNPENYTIKFNNDGKLNIQADCNQLVWSYEIDGSFLILNSTGPSTLAFCGDESLDTVYLEKLENIASYIMSDEKLYLNLFADAGNMVFSQ